jgi:hypothetical protein
MSDNQTVWIILWNHAAGQPSPGSPFEIDDVVPAVTAALHVPDDRARRLVGHLIGELNRLPEGHQFFAREGNAVVPLAEFLRMKSQVSHPVDVYPYEL